MTYLLMPSAFDAYWMNVQNELGTALMDVLLYGVISVSEKAGERREAGRTEMAGSDTTKDWIEHNGRNRNGWKDWNGSEIFVPHCHDDDAHATAAVHSCRWWVDFAGTSDRRGEAVLITGNGTGQLAPGRDKYVRIVLKLLHTSTFADLNMACSEFRVFTDGLIRLLVPPFPGIMLTANLRCTDATTSGAARVKSSLHVSILLMLATLAASGGYPAGSAQCLERSGHCGTTPYCDHTVVYISHGKIGQLVNIVPMLIIVRIELGHATVDFTITTALKKSSYIAAAKIRIRGCYGFTVGYRHGIQKCATEDEANTRDMDETVYDVTLVVKSCQMAVVLASPELEMRSEKILVNSPVVSKKVIQSVQVIATSKSACRDGTLVAAAEKALGKCIHRPNTLYTVFWRHANDKNKDVDVPGIDVPKE
ncbi:hypothetical protein DFH08DRAFT_809341 [Mycena albidolilacea]|uniref:Uncharacterized protein n=1 Tax=Mycena albidolilacea TaxID=1033008 RepID=A0AAD7ESZ2_9AGAR|nr:hypothetical protein DFH08DRAFT_809341 [Mycena albidolilacea]